MEHCGDQRELFIYFNKSPPRRCSQFDVRKGLSERRSKPHVSIEGAGGLGGKRGKGWEEGSKGWEQKEMERLEMRL